ncbi:hypothetical protein [Roseomonas gilardii]|uniref:hypothetical protein n=1 Tax=Roseomonas gilardii TaxID=257708 RepID=UPI001643A9DD|nr:hypothetical protein [Roseomonas gilardii]
MALADRFHGEDGRLGLRRRGPEQALVGELGPQSEDGLLTPMVALGLPYTKSL